MHTTHLEMLPTMNDFLNGAVAELQTSGGCAQSAVLFRENSPIVGILADFRGDDHKRAVWQTIIDTAHAFGCDGVGLVLDAFCSPAGTGLAPSKDPAAAEALLISTIFPGSWSWTMLRYGRDDDGSVHFAEKMEAGELDGSFDASMSLEMAQALEQPTFTDADEARRLIRQLMELGATVGLLPAYA